MRILIRVLIISGLWRVSVNIVPHCEANHQIPELQFEIVMKYASKLFPQIETCGRRA